MIKAELGETLLTFQRNEITEYHIYNKLALRSPDSANSKELREIAEDELRHYRDWQKYTGQEVA
jgi:rubrerythrin